MLTIPAEWVSPYLVYLRMVTDPIVETLLSVIFGASDSGESPEVK